MTQNEIILMARKSGFSDHYIGGTKYELERFAALIAAHEREMCAKVADAELMNTNMLTSYSPKSSAAWNVAAAIRARSENASS